MLSGSPADTSIWGEERPPSQG